MRPIDSVDVTGASVQIKTHVPPYNPNAYTSYWVGLDLPNDAFIQVGYVSWPSNDGYPVRFWEYFPPRGADLGTGFLGDSEGEAVGPNGTWYTYSIKSNGDTWFAYVNGMLEGSYDLGASSSGGNTPYAVAEVEGAYVTNIPLGPVEFRNLEYRDVNGIWHNVSSAVAWMGYGVGSGMLPSDARFPYGLKVLGVNDWIAGTGLSTAYNNTSIWSASSAFSPAPINSVLASTMSVHATLTGIERLDSRNRTFKSVSRLCCSL